MFEIREDGVSVCNIRTVASLNVILMNSFVGSLFQCSGKQTFFGNFEKEFLQNYLLLQNTDNEVFCQIPFYAAGLVIFIKK